MTILPRLEPPPKPYYVIDNIRYPRVTSIINVLAQPHIEQWRLKVGADEAKRVSKDATDWGSRLHSALEALNKGLYAKQDDDVDQHVAAYVEWFKANVYEVIAAERLCVSREFGFGGTADAVVRLKDGKLGVLDFKSSKSGPWDGLKPEHSLQTSAYRLALMEEDIFVKHRIVLQLPRNRAGTILEWRYPNHKADTDAFLACLELYQWLQTWQ